jgi:uncharacterized hydantoinase/oxoprolinase family protein
LPFLPSFLTSSPYYNTIFEHTQAREEIEKKIKDVMREKGLRELVIRGDQFEIVAQMADKPREYLDIKALKEDFGDAIKRYLKETYPIFVRWRKRTG